MDTQQLIQKIKQYPVAVGCGLLAIVCLAAVYLRSGTSPGLQAEVDSLSNQRATMLYNRTNGRGFEDQSEQLEGILTQVESRLMVPSDEILNREHVTRLQQRHPNITLNNRQQRGVEDWSQPPPGAPNIGDYSPISYQLSASGPYRDILAFLHDLENGYFYPPVEDRSGSTRTGEFYVRLGDFVLNNDHPENGHVNLVLDRFHILGIKEED